ncbi:MAG TPA: cation:proton antiporter [Chloroflexota bacterium]|nr:cation:proton antiporter [Chloroflexota bacterium]
MNAVASILVGLFIIFAAAKIAAEVFERLGQPPVIGELLAGVVIGPHALGLIGRPSAALIGAFHGDAAAAEEGLRLVYHVIAELGVIILLFFVGLETRVSDILRVGPRAAAVGVLGIVLPFALGLGFMVLQPTARLTDAFTATALVATSVGITARVLRDLGALGRAESRVILGAAVIDDILAMLLLAVVAALGAADGGAFSPWGLVALLGQAVGFVAFVVLVGSRVVRRSTSILATLRVEDAPFAFALMLTLGLAALSAFIGLAAIIGAFLAGMVLAETRDETNLEHQALPLYQFLVPFFFVITGAEMNPAVLSDLGVVGLAAGLTALAVLGKIVGGMIGAWGIDEAGSRLRSAALVGIGMVPRGEVGLIIAGIGRTQGVLPDQIFSAVVIMSIVTTLLAPPLLKYLLRGAATSTGTDAESPAPALETDLPRPSSAL